MKIKRIILIVIACLSIIVITIYNALIINPKDFTIREETIVSNKITSDIDGLLIVYFSDLHYKTYIDENDLEIIETKINAFKPDIVIFGGDLFDNALSGTELASLNNFLRNIEAKYGKYAILGDVDNTYYDQVNTIYKETNFKLLDNSNQKIYINGSFINLIGLNSLSLDSETALKGVNENYYTFCISHYPDLINDIDTTKIDYMLSGHSLGGQVYIPLINLFYRPEGAINYYHGKHNNNNIIVDITNGIGTINKNIRLFADAEIVTYKLKTIIDWLSQFLQSTL